MNIPALALAPFLASHLLAPTVAAGEPARGFLGIRDLEGFNHEPGRTAGEHRYLSPRLDPRLRWDQLVVSWNARLPPGDRLVVEARVIDQDSGSGFFNLGIWGGSSDSGGRTSVKGQTNVWGRVATDTLILRQPKRHLQIRVTLHGDAASRPATVHYLGLCFANTAHEVRQRPPLRRAWGRTIRVPERTQLDFPEGVQLWCSPTSTSMILAFWAQMLGRPELNQTVPEVALAVFDPAWPGTGNWPFNTAHAGSFPGMRATVARFSDVRELEEWTSRGLPIVASVDYQLLQGKPRRDEPDGHLVVCIGFTPEGDVIVNDPGKSNPIRRTYDRQHFIGAWASSFNTVYLIHPENRRVPPPRHGRW